MKNSKIPSKSTDKGTSGMRPNVMQRRPVAAKPSPAKPFKINRPQGK